MSLLAAFLRLAALVVLLLWASVPADAGSHSVMSGRLTHFSGRMIAVTDRGVVHQFRPPATGRVQVVGNVAVGSRVIVRYQVSGGRKYVTRVEAAPGWMSPRGFASGSGLFSVNVHPDD